MQVFRASDLSSVRKCDLKLNGGESCYGSMVQNGRLMFLSDSKDMQIFDAFTGEYYATACGSPRITNMCPYVGTKSLLYGKGDDPRAFWVDASDDAFNHSPHGTSVDLPKNHEMCYCMTYNPSLNSLIFTYGTYPSGNYGGDGSATEYGVMLYKMDNGPDESVSFAGEKRKLYNSWACVHTDAFGNTFVLGQKPKMTLYWLNPSTVQLQEIRGINEADSGNYSLVTSDGKGNIYILNNSPFCLSKYKLV